MGLDMYAYKVRADLVGDEQVDIPAYSNALKAIGFTLWADEDYANKSDEEKQAYWRARDEADARVKSEGIYDSDFAYWRKFNHLHGWMEQLYRSKGGSANSFNCVTVRLMPDDLDRLQSLAVMKALAPTQGFFFGGAEPFNDEDKQEVLDFVAKARQAIADGYVVLYDSWW